MCVMKSMSAAVYGSRALSARARALAAESEAAVDGAAWASAALVHAPVTRSAYLKDVENIAATWVLTQICQRHSVCQASWNCNFCYFIIATPHGALPTGILLT